MIYAKNVDIILIIFPIFYYSFPSDVSELALIFAVLGLGSKLNWNCQNRFRNDINSGVCSSLLLLHLISKALQLNEFQNLGFKAALTIQVGLLYGGYIASKSFLAVVSILVALIIITQIYAHQIAITMSQLLYPVVQQLFLVLLGVFLRHSLTFGESLIISFLSTMFFTDFLLICHNGVFLETPGFSVDPKLALSYGLVWGMLMIGLFTSPLLKSSYKMNESSRNSITGLRIAFGFGLATFSIVAFVLEPLMFKLIGHEPFLWTIEYISDLSSQRPAVIMYWLLLVGCAIWAANNLNWYVDSNYSSRSRKGDKYDKATRQSQIIDWRRKYFHFIATCLFIPVFFLGEIGLLNLSLSVALALFVFLEYIRACRIRPMSEIIQSFFEGFLDERDRLGAAVLSHIYLLVGCALPIWLNNLQDKPRLVNSLCGVLGLGVGDALASTVGKSYGTVRWPGLKKSLQGTLAFVLGLFGVTKLVAILLGEEVFGLKLLMVCTFTEAFSEQNDNLVVPLYMFSLLSVL